MPSLTIVNYLVERNNRWRNLWKTFELFEFLGILGWIVNIDNLDSRIAIYKRRGLTKVVELKPSANYLYIRGSVSGYIIALLGILEPRSFHDHEYPKSSLTVFHGLASFENYDGHENSKLSSFRRIHAIEDESIEERLEYRTIRSMEYILFNVETADMSWT